MDKKEQQAWGECMELWDIMSALEDMDIEPTILGRSKYFKDMVLTEIMGIEGDYNSGCPFCERYIGIVGCDGCPIYSEVKSSSGDLETFACFETEYKFWDNAVNEEGKHVQKYAQDFFAYLLKRYEERKAEDDDNSSPLWSRVL